MWEHLKESAKRQMVETMADHIALALSNLTLMDTLREQAIHDSLTGLFNRRYMEETLKRELSRAARKNVPLGIIMLDLDHFKQFNDTFGHSAGDALLRELGVFLQSHIRGEDIACRQGGEEFMLILPEASLDNTRKRAEQLGEEVKHLNVQYRGQSLGAVTLSIGVAVFPDHGLTVDSLLQSADSALYRAKKAGRDRVMAGEAIK
jgi:diguanylate cyclase (GGDEF)-like protein